MMNYGTFKNTVAGLKVSGFDKDSYIQLLRRTIEKDIKLKYVEPEELEHENYEYKISEDVLLIKKGLDRAREMNAWLAGIVAHYLNKEVGSEDYELYVLENLVLINLLISTFKIGRQGDYSIFYRHLTKERNIDYDLLLKDVETTYRNILMFCM